MRTFLPKVSPDIAVDRYRKFSRAARLAIGSDYVVHIADDGSQQVLFMKFQDMPEPVDMGLELGAAVTTLRLWGMVEEFEAVPKQYRNGSASQNSQVKGSRFAIHGKVYDAKKVDAHHLGGVVIDLVHAKECDILSLEFVEKVRPYLCLPEPD